VKYKSNYNIILSYLLLFSLLIVCGDIELNPGAQGTPVSHENTLSTVPVPPNGNLKTRKSYVSITYAVI
jgi:hypothetical protein